MNGPALPHARRFVPDVREHEWESALGRELAAGENRAEPRRAHDETDHSLSVFPAWAACAATLASMWREARPEDDDAITALCIALYEEDPASDPVPAEHHTRTLATLRAEPMRGRVLALEEDGAVRGYAILVPYWSNELGGEILIIDELYVAPSHRSRGRGRALLEALAQGGGLWPEKPVALELEVTPSNVRARALYEQLGFRPKRNAALRMKLR